jgi:hypothetical protein
MMTDQVIDNVLDAISETQDRIEALDEKPAKSVKAQRRRFDERLKLVRQLASLEKQLASFGKRGQERQKLRDDWNLAFFTVLMDVEPERVKDALAFFAKHDPAWLAAHDAKPKDDEYQQGRLNVIVYMLKDADEDFALGIMMRFLDSIRDADGNLPAWWTERYSKKTA